MLPIIYRYVKETQLIIEEIMLRMTDATKNTYIFKKVSSFSALLKMTGYNIKMLYRRNVRKLVTCNSSY